jgi:hypothetical protein
VGSRREERDYQETDDEYRRDDEASAAKLATKLVQSELKRRAAVSDRPQCEAKLHLSLSLLWLGDRKQAESVDGG